MRIASLVAAAAMVWGAAVGAARGQISGDPKAAVLRFLEAMDAGDVGALSQLIYAGDDVIAQRRRDVFARLVGAERALARVAQQRFGPEANRFAVRFDGLFGRMRRDQLAQAQVVAREGGWSALVVLGDEAWPIRVQRNRFGPWQVVLDLDDGYFSTASMDDVLWAEPMADIQVERNRAIADTMGKIAQRVQSGAYPSAAAVEAELTKLVSDANATALRKRAELIAETRRKKQWGW